MSRKITLAAFLSYCLAGHAWAQRPVEGFVVTIAGDTIYGELYQSESDARQHLIHLGSVTGTTATYTAATIKNAGRKGYSPLDRMVYGPKRTPILVEPIVKGPLRLYKGYLETGQDPHFSSDVSYFLQHPDSTSLTYIDPKNLTLSLVRLLGDCPTMNISKQLAARPKSYNSTQLTHFVREYATCRFPNSPVQLAKPYKGWYTSWGVKAGLDQGQLRTPDTFLNLAGVEFTKTTNWQAGLFANLAYWNGFSIQAEAHLVKFKGDNIQAIYSGTSAYSITRTSRIESQLVRVPVMLRYQVGHGLVRPYFLAGPHTGYNISHSLTIQDQRSNETTFGERLFLWPEKIVYGLQAGAGVYIALPDMPGVSLESMYSRSRQGTDQKNHLFYQDVAIMASTYF